MESEILRGRKFLILISIISTCTALVAIEATLGEQL
jgi:hypothetical protein